jgi:CRISPR-associated protein Cas1
MESVVVSDFGVVLGQRSERLVVRGPRPRLELVEGGPQLFLPLGLPPPRWPLRLITSVGERQPAVPLRKPRPGPRTSPEEIELPLFRVSEIVVASRGVSISSDLIEACCERGIRISFLSPNGRPYAMLSSPTLSATVQTRRAQMAAYVSALGAELCRTFVVGKLRNQANLLKYFGKYQKQAAPETYAVLTSSTRCLVNLCRAARGAPGESPDDVRPALMGIEGSGGRFYWEGVGALLRGSVEFNGREHRGTAHPVNAALNYGYGILYSHVWGAIMNAGLEPFAGFLHVDRPGKPSLVLDLVEEFRQPIVDRAVISLVHKGTTLGMREGMLDDDTRRIVAAVVLDRLEAEASYRSRRLRLRSIIQIQARRIAAFVRGEGIYRPFAFKW